jgi:hypothetical protein
MVMKRNIAWFLAIVALVGFPAWALWQASADAAAQRQVHGFVCGMPTLAIYFLALIGSSLLSVAALSLAVPVYRALPKPRPRSRAFELLVFAIPLFAAAIMVLWLWALTAKV